MLELARITGVARATETDYSESTDHQTAATTPCGSSGSGSGSGSGTGSGSGSTPTGGGTVVPISAPVGGAPSPPAGPVKPAPAGPVVRLGFTVGHAPALSGSRLDTGIVVGCPAGGATCTVTGSLTSASASGRATAAKAKKALTRVALRARPGSTAKVVLRLPSSALKALRKKGVARFELRLAVQAGSAKPVTLTRTLTVKAKKTKKH